MSWRSLRSNQHLPVSLFLPTFEPGRQTKDEIKTVINLIRFSSTSTQIMHHTSSLTVLLLTCLSRALLATVQVDLDERDGLIIVLFALLEDDKDVLLILWGPAVQWCEAGVAARPRPYLQNFILPRFAVGHRPSQGQVNSWGDDARSYILIHSSFFNMDVWRKVNWLLWHDGNKVRGTSTLLKYSILSYCVLLLHYMLQAKIVLKSTTFIFYIKLLVNLHIKISHKKTWSSYKIW